jgi:hypothetical protein
LDTTRLNGALESIKNGNYTYDKLMDTFELTEAQIKKADKFIKELQEAEAEVKEEKELETENK